MYDIGREMERKAAQLQLYIRDEFPRMAMRKALRFVDGNFRAQGWQGRSFLPWQKNKAGSTTLIKSGALRRSIHGAASPYEARIWSDSPYARFHNRGFKGTVNVKAHTRNAYSATRVATGRYSKNGTERQKTVHQVAAAQQVSAHTRKVDMPRRQFMPEDINDSPVLFDSIKRDLINHIKTIFN